ncbi:Bacteriophage Lambda NinG protein [compost metagenome]
MAGNAVEYRVRLIDRIGLARVEALEADNKPRKFTAGELREIRDTYRAKTKELKRGNP